MNGTSSAASPSHGSAAKLNTASKAASDTPDDVFDPFGLGDTSMNAMDVYLQDGEAPAPDDGSSTRSPKPPPQLTRLAAVKKKDSPTRSQQRISSPLPPKIVVKLGMHEEVSSMAKGGPEDDGTSEVSVEGTVYVSPIH